MVFRTVSTQIRECGFAPLQWAASPSWRHHQARSADPSPSSSGNLRPPLRDSCLPVRLTPSRTTAKNFLQDAKGRQAAPAETAHKSRRASVHLPNSRGLQENSWRPRLPPARSTTQRAPSHQAHQQRKGQADGDAEGVDRPHGAGITAAPLTVGQGDRGHRRQKAQRQHLPDPGGQFSV